MAGVRGKRAGWFLPVAALFLATPARAATFSEQHAAVAGSIATQPEAVIQALLKAGLEEGKPVLASADAAKWLQQNQPQDAALYYQAARAAELSGDWKGAVALYQQYLKKADLTSAQADEAVYAVYVLLIERLADVNGAYAFGRTDGGRLLVCPRARQFDQWFLDEAVRRDDPTAVAERLHACINAGLPNDLLVARYSSYFRWLLSKYDWYCAHTVSVTQDSYDAVKDLTSVMTFDEELKLRLDWAISVMAYNQAKLGSKAVTKAGKRAPGKVRGLSSSADKKPSNKQEAGKRAADAKAAAAQVVEEKKLELGDDVTPPIAESAALLEKYPKYVLRVMTGWAGGGNGPYYRDDPKKYWPHEAEAKMAPILAALTKLTPAEAAEFLNAAVYGGYVNSPGILELKSVQEYLKANPGLANSRNGVMVLEKEWNKLTPEEAQKLAPSLAPSANPLASLVRAIAAGGRDYDKVMAALLGPEVWRLGPGELNNQYADSLWHSCGRPGGNQKRDEWIAKSQAVAASFAAGDAKKEDPADKRIAAFRNLWNDCKSAQPKSPNVRARVAAVLKLTPEVVPELLKDADPEAQRLVRDAIAAGMEDAKGAIERDDRARGIPYGAYSPWFLRFAPLQGGVDHMKQYKKELYVPHPLEPALRTAVAERLAQGKIEPWLTMAWINTQFPENNAEQVKLMQALFASPLWQAMPFEVEFGARDWFRKDAMTPAQIAWVDAADPKSVCRDMLALTNTSEVATVVAALQSAIAGVRKSPVRMEVQGMDRLGMVTNTAFADPKVYEQVLEIADALRDPCRIQGVGYRLLSIVKEKREPVMLHRAASYLWSCCVYGNQRDPFPQVRQLAESLMEEQPATANAMARYGLNHFAGLSGAWAFNPATDIPALKALQGRSAMKLGLATIPVAPTHPAYPVYKAQADWLEGNEDSAWRQCGEHWEALVSVHRELSVEFQFWLLQRAINTRDEARQESLVKAMRTWAAEAGSPLGPAAKADLEIAYADIAVQRGMVKEAREILTRVMQDKANEGQPGLFKAALGRVRVDRMAKDFNAALETLTELELKVVPEWLTPIRFARAEVHFDMEDYNAAADDIEAILAREPGHADGLIMQGKLQIKRKRLMEATEVEVGSASRLEQLVPGNKLKVTLNDPSLAVSGAGTEIEVTVRAASGDQENILLRQFGDQKTKFRGELDTALGAPKPGDRVLQVTGDDKVYYGYSEAYRRKMNNLAEKQGGPITVASDALLMVSARKLLTEDEQRLADMQAEMAKLQLQGGGAAATARGVVQSAQSAKAEQALQEGVDRDEIAARNLESLQKRLQAETVKPGAPVYVRVVDPDRSRTAGIDEVAVSVESSSGDSIGRVVLKETGPYTGWFEGHVKTAGAQAMAFAENSEPGRNPNMVISPVADYPPWRPVAVKDRSPELKVNLNDNVALGELTITAKEPGAKLKTFAVYAGMNPREMTPVTAYPHDLVSVAKPWHPSVTIMSDTDYHHTQNLRSVYDIRELEYQLDRGWMSQQFATGITENVAGPSVAMTNSIPAKVKWLRQNQHHNAHVVYRFRGYFYEPADVMRGFRVELGPWTPPDVHPSVAHPAQYMLAVDGRIITDKTKPNLLEGGIELKKGVHRFEFWATGWDCRIGFGRSVKLLANLGATGVSAGPEGQPYPGRLVECPDRFFDPQTFPKGVLAQRNGKATIAADADGAVFKVKFAPGSAARLMDLVFVGQEGPVPVVNKVALTGPDGKRVLPVADDFARLNKNETLEILPGDRVAVRYVDDRFVTRSKEKHERFVAAAFSNAEIGFLFHEKRKDRNGDDVDYYEPLLRFATGDSVLLRVEDPDMDMTPQPDKVEVTLESKAGGKRRFVATETSEASGVFQVRVTPVSGTPTNELQIAVQQGDTLTATYRDQENTEPGIPVDRYATIRHARYTPPALTLAHSAVTAIAPKHLPRPVPLVEGFNPTFWSDEAIARLSPAAQKALTAGKGSVQPRWGLVRELRPVNAPPTNGFESVSGRLLCGEVEAPFLALRAGSMVEVYVQTEAGRALAAKTAPPAAGATNGAALPSPAFDLRVPGTLRLDAALAASGGDFILPGGVHFEIPIYQFLGFNRPAAAAGERFAFSVPLIAWPLPDHGILTGEELDTRRKMGLSLTPHGLSVRPGEQVYVGFRYEDDKGVEQWLTTALRVTSHPVLDVMESDYRTAKTNAFVGESLFIRVVDLGADVSDSSDSVTVALKSQAGAKHALTLTEVDTHSGVFKGVCPLTYAMPGAGQGTNGEYDVTAQGFPVVYGDVMAVRYADTKGTSCWAQVSLCKGADGTIVPFSKRYEDATMAMRTQFAMAEGYLEVARSRRAAGDAVAAEREFDNAKQLLATVIDQFREPETRAHAEYLLANLTLEEAESADKPELKESRYRAALSRFMNVTGTYPDTLHASRAQFKIATVFERLKEPDVAAVEYVKLAYKYPDSEYLAVAMARLGTHFQRKAAEYEAQAKPLLEKTGDKDAQFEGTARQQMAVREYLKAASIFRRLLERFPSHELAGSGGLKAGQSYMRAGDNRQAVKMFVQVLDNTGFNGPEVRAQAMYWAGMCYEGLKEPMAAYAIYKRLTYDFPETKWASYARAQLSQDGMVNLETDLEIKQLGGGK